MAKASLKLDLKGLKFDPQKAKEVLGKFGVVIVSGLVVVVAPVVAFIVSDGMNASLRADAEARAAKQSELASLEASEMTLALPNRKPVTVKGVINEYRISQYKSHLATVAKESLAARQLALEHNRKGRSPVMSMRLAKGDPAEKGLPLMVFDALAKEYASLLEREGAGAPYPEQEIVEQLLRRRSQIVDAQFGAKAESELSAEERATLEALLSAERLGRYCEAARGISIYADAASIGTPDKARRTTKAKPLDLFLMQWNYWVAEDILTALSGLNGERDVISAPVKRILALSSSLQARGAPRAGGEGSSAGEGAATDGAPASADGAPASAEGAATEVGTEPATQATGQPVDPDAPLPAPDYSASLTGRISNQAFDVMLTELQLVVETDAIPLVMDALVRRNFITVLDARIRPVDSFAAAEDGYVYGADPVSLLSLRLESVWLREWTGPFMPDDLRARLGTTGLVARSASEAGNDAASEPTAPDSPSPAEPQG
jgi:hypothetical protein